jgi:hypothetical protein
MVADAQASASIPMERRAEPGQPTFEVLESSGKGADQFEKAIKYFEGKQTQSVLASFMDLAQNASLAHAGSNALSADQSEFYLASRQAVATEIAQQITDGIIAPLIVNNFGPDAPIPELHFAPIGNRQTDRAMLLLTSIVSAEKPTIPEEFTGFLINQVSAALGLDTDEVSAAVTAWGIKRQKEMDAAEAAAAAAAEIPVPLAPPSTQQALPGADALAKANGGGGNPATAALTKGAVKSVPKPGKVPGPTGTPTVLKSKVKGAQLSMAIDMANELMVQAQNGVDPREVLRALAKP